MEYSFLSLAVSPPEGFQFVASPDMSKFRRGVFCLYADNSECINSLILPWVDKIFGIVVVCSDRWEWRTLGEYCYVWFVPHSVLPCLAAIVSPYLELIERARKFDDIAKAKTWEAQRALQDRVFLSKVQLEFRDAMMVADKNLRAAHRYLNQIIEFLPDPAMVIDRDKKVVAWNRAMEKITGVRKEAMIGKGDYEYAFPFYGERRPMLVDLLYFSDDEIIKKYTFVKREGNIIFAEVFVPKINSYLSVSASLLFDAEGNIIGAIETIRDVTDYHKAMQELQKAKQAAEEAQQAQSRFLSNVSHEIRTPLNGIIGFSELIMRERNIEKVHSMAQTALHESDILLSLVNGLLDQARIESGKMEIEYVGTDIHEMIDMAVKTVEVQAAKKGLVINVEMPLNLPRYLFADRLRLCQVMLNLLNNAVKFTERGTVVLRVSVDRSEADKKWIRFEVIDTGTGIPDDKKHLIFERFAQVDAAASRKYGGTGLGLCVSRELVELMGGEIGFESTVHQGSKFWFVLPFTVANVSLKEHPYGTHPGKELKGERYPVLLVEDYLPNQEVAKMHLESAGYQVEIAGDGIAALKACEAKEYKLLIMDVQMPVMDGLETTRRLRQIPGWTQHVVILGLTANADEKSRKDCLSAGMDGVATKPIRREMFLAEVARSLHGIKLDAPGGSGEQSKQRLSDLPMDYSEALREFSGNKKFLDIAISSFLKFAQIQTRDIERYIAAEDAPALGREAHKIKGASANLTALRLSATAKAMEEKSKSGDMSEIWDLFIEFKKELNILDTYVKNNYANYSMPEVK